MIRGSIKTSVHQFQTYNVNCQDPFLEKLKETCMCGWTSEQLGGRSEPEDENLTLLQRRLS